MKLLKLIRESLRSVFEEELLDEERITNKEAADYINRKENFVGSHTYGEDLGGHEEMYVAYSYGEQHPLYLYDRKTDSWYYNYEDYLLPDGTVNVWTRRHLKDLRPNEHSVGKPKSFLQLKIKQYKKKRGLGSTVHKDLEPGEK